MEPALLELGVISRNTNYLIVFLLQDEHEASGETSGSKK